MYLTMIVRAIWGRLGAVSIRAISLGRRPEPFVVPSENGPGRAA